MRVIAATNVDLKHLVSKGKFRADLYYRLNAVSITMPALRERPGDINLLFRKFASDFASKYGMSKVVLTEDASILLRKQRWPGNIRQLKNVAETVTALESSKMTPGAERCIVDVGALSRYLPVEEPNLLPATVQAQENFDATEREAIIRTLLQLKQDVDYLKEVIAKAGLGRSGAPAIAPPAPQDEVPEWQPAPPQDYDEDPEEQSYEDVEEKEPESISISKVTMDLIMKALEKHNGNRNRAAKELGISERTLYRRLEKMKEK